LDKFSKSFNVIFQHLGSIILASIHTISATNIFPLLQTSQHLLLHQFHAWPCLDHSHYKANPPCVFILQCYYKLVIVLAYLAHFIMQCIGSIPFCRLPSQVSLTMVEPITLHGHSIIMFHPNITLNLSSLQPNKPFLSSNALGHSIMLPPMCHHQSP
jgi:hypothetical protein